MEDPNDIAADPTHTNPRFDRLEAWGFHLRQVNFCLLHGAAGVSRTLACRDHVVRVVFLQRREVDMRNGARMTMACQRDVLSRDLRSHPNSLVA